MLIRWLSVCLFFGAAPIVLADDFAIRDGDTVVFLGDSITAARTYGRYIETYALLRYPERRVRFINAGWGGDTAAGGRERLQRDVLDRGATVVTVAYGINDIGWGGRADEEHKQKYLDGIRGIVEACKARNVRVYICSAAITGADPHKSEDDFLQRMCDEGMALARSLGGFSIDVQRTMREIQKRVWAANEQIAEPAKKESLHAADGIHLNDLGQLAMAFAIIKGLGAPAEVSSVTIDAAGPTLTEARGCRVSGLEKQDRTLSFDRLDEGLPFNLSALWLLQCRFVPIPDELNRYMLRVTNLPAGDYELLVGERPVGTFSNERWAAGVNLSSATPNPWEPGGPWHAQAALLYFHQEARWQLDLADHRLADHLAANPLRSKIMQQQDDVAARLMELQRTLVRPYPYRFVIRPAKG